MDRSALRVAELEQELQELRSSTTEALEEAWGEVETLTQENSHREALLFRMQHQLGDKLSEESSHHPAIGSGNRRRSLAFSRADSTKSGLSMGSVASNQDDTIGTPARGGCLSPHSGHGGGPLSPAQGIDGMSVITFDSNESNESNTSGLRSLLSSTGLLHRKDHGQQQKRDRKQTEIEKNLMRQLEIMQEDRNRTVHEYEIKLQQREDAIETLERTVKIRDESIEDLRDELDRMRQEQRRHPPPDERWRSNKPRRSVAEIPNTHNEQ